VQFAGYSAHESEKDRIRMVDALMLREGWTGLDPSGEASISTAELRPILQKVKHTDEATDEALALLQKARRSGMPALATSRATFIVRMLHDSLTGKALLVLPVSWKSI
jgi:hypothetical protein